MSLSRFHRQDRIAWAFIAPALILIAVFFAIPVLTGLVLSFTDFDLYAIGDPSVARWIGVRNYGQVLADAEVWNALRNTLVYVAVGGPLSVAVSLGAALLVNSQAARFKSLYRVIFYMPVVTTLVAVSIVWRYLYHPRYGLIDSALAGLGIKGPDWLGDPRYALFAIILLAVWKNFGYNMLILVAALQSIPAEQYEAARLDGASGWRQFRHITWPALGATFLFVGVTTMVANFQLFSEPYVMTQGGPLRSTVSMVLLMYEQGFRWWRLGLASALAFVLFALMLVGALVQMRIQKVRES